MLKRLAVSDTADLLPFIASHGQLDRDAASTFLLTLSLRPEGVFDLHDDAGRTVVAVLTDACDNSGDAAELLLLASRSETVDEDLLELLLTEALVEARFGPRRYLEVTLESALRPHQGFLAARGFAPRFDIVTMEQHGSWQAVEPPCGWTWADLSAERYDEAARLMRAAFTGHPGVNFPPAEQARARALGSPQPIRLLLDGDRVAGLVTILAKPDGSGMVTGLARHPDDRGHGLGAALLTGALQQLEAAGHAPVRLGVVATNEGALTLYKRFGFQAIQAVSIHALAIRA